MRRYLKLAMVIAPAAAVALAVSPAYAATGHVLTIGKTGGTAVKTNAVLKSGLASGATATFKNSSGTLTCKTATFSTKVTANPAKPGTATESLTGQTFGKCSIPVAGATVKSIKLSNLPYKVTVSDGKGDPVKISGQSKSKPITLTVSVAVSGIGTITCAVSAASISGHASNTGNEVTFSGQKLTYHGSNPFCSSGTFSAKFGPLTDSSVKGSPKVFVN